MLDFSQPDTPQTPEQKQRKRRRTTWTILGFEIAIILCFKGGVWFEQLRTQALLLGLPWPMFVLGWVIILPVLYLLLIFLHEAGHAVGAVLARFRILTFVVNRLCITRQANGWQVRFRKPQKGLGGMVNVLAPDTHNLRSRYALLIAGGPVANLLIGGLTLYLAYNLVIYSAVTAPLLSSYLLHYGLLTFGWLSVVVGALNLLPLNSKAGHIMDGKRLKQLIQGGPAMHQTLGMLHLQSLTYAGVRPRDWDLALVEQFVSHRSNTVLDCYSHLSAYSYFHDRNDLEQIRFHLNEALDRRALAPVGVQQYLLAEAAYVAALHACNVEQARYWLDKAQDVKPFTKEEGLFSQAAVAYVEGRFLEAESFLQAARTQLQEAINTGGTTQALERMDDLQNRINQAQQLASA